MSTCLLCEEPLIKTGSLRLNTAAFPCGDEFHLSCVLTHSRERLTTTCPKCNPTQSHPFANFGEDRIASMQALIECRRRTSNLEVKPAGVFGNWFTNKKNSSLLKDMVGKKTLQSLKLEGYIPDSFVEQEAVTWSKLTSAYSLQDILDFGFNFQHAVVLGFSVDDLKGLKFHELKDKLNIRSTDILKLEVNIRQLAALQLECHELHELGFTWRDLKLIGGNCETMRLLSANLAEIKTYFEPQPSWESAGFTQESIEQYDYDTSEYNPVRVKRGLSKKPIHVNGMVF
jgi:hypothetical protein